MTKAVIVEDSLKQHLLDQAPTAGFIFGLVLGHRSAQRDFLVHLPTYQTILQKGDGDQESTEAQTFNSFQDLNIKSFVLYAKQVTAFLPGGIQILGIFSCGPDTGGLLDPSQSTKLQSFMPTLFNKLAVDSSLYGASITSTDKLIMHFSPSTKKVTCKSINLSDSKWYLNNVDCKSQSQPISWQQVECRYGFDYKMPITEKKGANSLKTNLDLLLKYQASKIREAYCLMDGQLHDSATLESILSTDDELETEPMIRAELQLLCKGTEGDIEYRKCSGDMLISGHVYSRVYLQPKASTEEAIAAVKEDLIRSLQTRFELHTDALIEEEEGSPEEKIVQHDLPRRVLFPLPCSQVKLSNYLFPGESSYDSMSAVMQLLGIELDEDDIEQDLEQEADPEMMPILASEEIDQLSCPQTPQPEPEHSFMSLYTGLAVAALFLALCTTLFLLSDEDETPPR